jgi:hypothetical protein
MQSLRDSPLRRANFPARTVTGGYGMALLIKAEELKGLISIKEAIAAVREGFRDQGEKPDYSAPRPL